MTDVYDEGALAVFERQIDEWLARFQIEDPSIEAVDRGDGDDLRWYVRMHGESKEHTTIWLTLGQRTLRYEAYVMPAPLENVDAVYESALRRNERMVGAHFAIGVEDALFVRGELPLVALCEAELDRIIGSVYAYVEQSFPNLIRLGYASHFANEVSADEG
jgi:Putative bacterial sensory transduction regulator